MPTILIVDKTGNIKESNIKQFSEDELYKKAGFKSNNGFQEFITWDITINEVKYAVALYGKTTGKANTENKYEFPPPADNTLFFGNCILVNKVNHIATNLTEKEWTMIYEQLYGGFEDLDDENDETEEDTEEEEVVLNIKKTKDGYVKDDFIIDDDDEDDIGGEEEDDEEMVYKKKKTEKKRKTAKQIKLELEKNPETYLDCTSELSEESYV
jgi:hypothetical protein